MATTAIAAGHYPLPDCHHAVRCASSHEALKAGPARRTDLGFRARRAVDGWTGRRCRTLQLQGRE
eukprot:10271532-Alexandrium_andersonii.AAC.1